MLASRLLTRYMEKVLACELNHLSTELFNGIYAPMRKERRARKLEVPTSVGYHIMYSCMCCPLRRCSFPTLPSPWLYTDKETETSRFLDRGRVFRSRGYLRYTGTYRKIARYLRITWIRTAACCCKQSRSFLW